MPITEECKRDASVEVIDSGAVRISVNHENCREATEFKHHFLTLSTFS